MVQLDLSGNDIVKLPDDMNCLDRLTELNLSDNKIVMIPRGFCTGAMATSLRLLNLANNQVALLPSYFCRLVRLVTLNLDNNQLTVLPPAMGRMDQLKFLTADNNRLSSLPGTVVRLRLDNLALSGNPLSPGPAVARPLPDGMPSLLELVARHVVTKRTPYCEEDLPGRLMEYLDSYTQCLCGRPVWNTGTSIMVNIEARRLANTFAVDRQDSLITINATVCSQACQDRYKNNPFAV